MGKRRSVKEVLFHGEKKLVSERWRREGQDEWVVKGVRWGRRG